MKLVDKAVVECSDYQTIESVGIFSAALGVVLGLFLSAGIESFWGFSIVVPIFLSLWLIVVQQIRKMDRDTKRAQEYYNPAIFLPRLCEKMDVTPQDSLPVVDNNYYKAVQVAQEELNVYCTN